MKTNSAVIATMTLALLALPLRALAAPPGWAAQIFSSRSGAPEVDRACREMGLRRLDNNPTQWSCANDQVIVFVSVDKKMFGRSNEIYLVVGSTSGVEADWVVRGIQNKLLSNFTATIPPPPTSRGRGVVQWLQIRQRDRRGGNPKNAVQAALGYYNWENLQWGDDGCWASRGEKTLLIRWTLLPGNQIKYYVFVYQSEDPNGSGNRACQDVAQYLMTTIRID